MSALHVEGEPLENLGQGALTELAHTAWGEFQSSARPNQDTRFLQCALDLTQPVEVAPGLLAEQLSNALGIDVGQARPRVVLSQRLLQLFEGSEIVDRGQPLRQSHRLGAIHLHRLPPTQTGSERPQVRPEPVHLEGEIDVGRAALQPTPSARRVARESTRP